MLSFSSLSIGLDAFYRYSFITEQIDILTPSHQDKAIEILKSIETLEDAKNFSSRVISSKDAELKSTHELLEKVSYGAKESFFQFIIMSSISASLVVVLIVGLMPIFGKGSNKSLKSGTPQSGAP